jgi:hypothetical protein
MDSTTRATGCQFCGAKSGLTREHVLAQWVRPLLTGPRAPYVAETDGRVTRVWEAPIASLTVRRVCRRCNNGWMHELEVAAKPIVTELLESRVRTLTVPDQTILGAWGAKTAMSYDLTQPRPTVPFENRSWLRERRELPPATVMLVARYGGTRFPLLAAHGTKTFNVESGAQTVREWRGYLISISVGPLVLQLFGHAIANAIDLRPRGWKADFARVMWPDPEPLTWPLPLALGDDGLRAFVNEV